MLAIYLLLAQGARPIAIEQLTSPVTRLSQRPSGKCANMLEMAAPELRMKLRG